MSDNLTILYIIILVQVCNFSWYVWGIYKNDVKPHAFSWLIWSTVLSISGFIQLASGAGLVAYTAILGGMLSFIRMLYGFTHGVRDYSRGDFISLGLCFFAVILWIMTKDPFLSNIIVTLIALVAFYPTVRKSFISPHEESFLSFAIFGSIFVLSASIVDDKNLNTMLYPCALAITDFLVAFMILIRRWQVQKCLAR